MKLIRVLIVDDSAFMRKMISNILKSDSRIQVVGTARNGIDGINKIKTSSPDVVTMDVNMPVLDGISALQKIMQDTPLPVIMLSSETASGTDSTINAIENGAVDFIMKPSGEISLNIDDIKNEIIAKVIAAASATITTESKVNIPHPPKQIVQQRIAAYRRIEQRKRTLIVIGTSTGGPRALQRLVNSLPANFKTPILIVQHMPPGFTKSLANRLNSLSDLTIKEAEHGEIIEDHSIYIAPGDYHMKVEMVGTALVIKNTKEEPVNNHRPSVDTLFHSVAKLDSVNKIAVILTGMGNDGSKGIVEIKQQDQQSIILSESQETSVIYGMPKAAYETKVVDQVLPLDQIGGFLGEITQTLNK